jgi:putative aldouronate transport system permease protein
MGSMMDVGFEHIFVLQNSAVRNVADVISTYVYRVGIQGIQYSYTAALGLFQSLISMVLILSSNKIIKTLGENGLW